MKASIYRTGCYLNSTQEDDLRSFLAEKYIEIVRRINRANSSIKNPHGYVYRALDWAVLEYVIKEVLNNRNRRYLDTATEELDCLPDQRPHLIPFYELDILHPLADLEKKVISLKANKYTHLEISYLMGITVDVCKKTYQKAKNKLLKYIKEASPDKM
ncbi:MAG: hypothetical protein ABFD79_16205 [Phycisphaerales bacterium]